MPLPTGARLGPYTILTPLGEGGMGEVYKARDARLDRDVAVKVLPAHLSEDATSLARFEREAKAVAALSHPNILGIFDVGREGSTAFVVTELLEGETLRERLRHEKLSWRRAVEIATAIADGLASAHGERIIHRDLKPENVFVAVDGQVKILDFGLAKQEQPAADLGATDTPTKLATTDPGVVLGTVAYMAPEQVRGQKLDHRADLFAFGAILYEMLAGRRAFQRETAAETMTAILKEDPPELTAVDPKIPQGLARLVQHCLEKRPQERFQSARDLAFDLQAIATASTSGAQPVAVSVGRWRRWLPATGLAVVVAAAGYMAGRFVERRAVSPPPTFRQLTFRPEAILHAAFAPDGETIVFSALVEGNAPELFMLRPEYPEPTALGLPRTHVLAVSSKGELAVLTDARCMAWRSCVGTLARVPLGGTGPRAILDRVSEADWSPDGTALAVIRTIAGKDRLEYPIGSVLYESSGWLTHVRVSPRQSRVALLEHPNQSDDRGFVITVDRSGKRTVLAGEYSALEGLAWSPTGDEALFTGIGLGDAGYGAFAAYGVDLAGHVRYVVRSAGGVSLHDISRRGRWLVTRDDRAIGIRARAPAAQAERDLSFLDGSVGPVLSPDGRTLLFTEVSVPVGGNYSFYMRGTDGSPVIRLGEGSAVDLSPDGKWALALTQSPQQLVIYPTGSGEKRTLERGGLVGYTSAAWFPEGKRILVCGSEQGKAARCYAQDSAGGPPRAVTPDGEKGVVSPDGRRIAVWRPRTTPAIYRLDGSGREEVPSASDNERPIAWSADGQSLIVGTTGRVPGRIERVDLRSGKRELVRELAPADPAGILEVFPRSVAADPAVYAYEYYRMRSTLFLVEGAR